MFPPVPADGDRAGYEDFADRWNPILDVFDEHGVRFAHEVHPGEIAYDYWTSVRALEAIDQRAAFGFNWDPSHMMWQNIDPVGFIWDFRDRIYHVDCKDTRLRPRNGRAGVLGSHLPWGDPRRGWDFVSTGHGDVPGRTRSGRSTRSATPDRSRSSGRTPEWTACTAQRRRSSYVRSLLWPRPTTRRSTPRSRISSGCPSLDYSAMLQ